MGWTDFWTDEEDARLIEKYSHDAEYQDLLKFFPDRRSAKSIKQRAVRLGLTRGRRLNQTMRGAVTHRTVVPAHIIAERDERINEYRTPAQIMLGDPPFSQSALGRSNG